MENLYLVLHFLFVGIMAGVLGTSGMTFAMHLITKTGLTNADMVRAIGSIFTRSLESSTMVGFFVHYTAGIAFALAYIIIFNVFGVVGFLTVTIAGMILGFIHGFVVSFLLVVSVAEHHPLEEFRKAGFSVAAAHIVGHIVYGILVGAVVGISGFQLAAAALPE